VMLFIFGVSCSNKQNAENDEYKMVMIRSWHRLFSFYQKPFYRKTNVSILNLLLLFVFFVDSTIYQWTSTWTYISNSTHQAVKNNISLFCVYSNSVNFLQKLG
jgi:hypothetical protein